MNVTKGYTFDDVLLVPQHSKIKSRSDVDLSVQLGKDVKLDIPIVSANMKTVTGPEMAIRIAISGGLAILHRFHDEGETGQIFDYLKIKTRLERHVTPSKNMAISNVAVSVGVAEKDKNLVDLFVNEHYAKIICIDVAHGDHDSCLNMVQHVNNNHPEVLLIAGNIATPIGAQRLYEAGADVIKAGVGPGCFIAGTRVLMSNGTYKNIENIEPGDKVINKNGNPVKVSATHCTGIRRVSKIRHTLSHKPIYATPDHKFWVGDLNTISKSSLSNRGYAKHLDKQSKTTPRQSKYKWKEVKDCEQDCFLMPNKINFELNKYFEIKLYKRDGGNGRDGKKKLDVVMEPSYNLGYLFGTFLGDGHALSVKFNNSKIGSVFWYFGKNENYIVEKLITAVQKCIGKTPVVKEKDNMLQLELYYKPLADFLFSFGKRKNKYLPSEYLIDDKEYLQGLLDGLVDSDGHIEQGGRVRFSNTSENLVELFGVVNYLLTGVFPNQQMRAPTTGALKNANIENFNDGYVSGILTTGNKRLTKDYQVAKLLEVQDTNVDMLVYDITVDCDTHSFIANNSIVHNSLCTTRVETGNGVPQLTALEQVYQQSFLPQQKRKFKIIADGGIKSAGDITKALCFSDCVMLGNLLAGTDEAPGQNVSVDGINYKTYVGSSTHKTNHIEGVSGLVPSKGPVKNVIQHLMQGLKSGLSYQGSRNLTELKDNPQFISISNAGLIESKPHNIIVK